MKPTSSRITVAAVAAVAAAIGTAAAAPGEGLPGGSVQSFRVSVPVGPYALTQTAEGHELSVEGYGHHLAPGKPQLPARIFAVALPPGARILDVRCVRRQGVQLPGTYRIPPVPLPRVIGPEDPAVYAAQRAAYDAELAATCGSDDPYPVEPVELVREAGYRKYNLVDLRVTPCAYRPRSGRLTWYPQVTVELTYRMPERPVQAIADHLADTEAIARRIILNYDQAARWYREPAAPEFGPPAYVIITTDELIAQVAPLAEWEALKGRTVQLVTTSWIYDHYPGIDPPQRIRNFLREKYPSDQWGIRDLLLVGSYSDVPMRQIALDIGYGKPRTDFYYAELSKPDSESWDADGDLQWGEDGDAVDFYSEINVGRIPWSVPEIVQHICEKSVAFEQNGDPEFKKSMLLLGAFFWPDTDNAVLMETKIDQPWMADWTMTRLYEKNADVWSAYPCDYPLYHENVMAVWPYGKFAFVNWAGHGSPTTCHIYGEGAPHFVQGYDGKSLNDDYPAIVFAAACSNSDTDYLNIGQSLIRQGAVGFVGATQVANGYPGWDSPTDGSSQSLDYFFTTAVTSQQYTQGAALQEALRQMNALSLWWHPVYETCQWGALWGNPDLSMAPAPALVIRLPDGPPAFVDPGQPTTIPVEIRETTDQLVAGTALLHYRLGGGPFASAPLTPVSGDLFQATLPAAGCADEPEFYFSAQAAAAGVIHEPPGAPADFFSSVVGEPIVVFADDFETETGWTTEVLGATAGWWERGVPVDDPGWDFDPYACPDGGACFLTQNQYGPSDVDDGAVRLTSPLFDLSGGYAAISYDYFLRLTATWGGVDRILVEISGNGDAGPWVEIARHDQDGALDWHEHTIPPEDLGEAGVVFTPTMKLRFTTNDADDQSINESGLDSVRIMGRQCAWAGPGDCDQDGDIDLDDFAVFAACLTGPSGEPPPGCDLADLDGDTDVDLADAARFQGAFTG